MTIWLPSQVEDRLERAALVIRLLPAPRRTRPQGLFAHMPDVVREAREAYGWDKPVTMPARPSAQKIQEADEAASWLWWLELRPRSVTWAKANGATWRMLEDLDGSSTWLLRKIYREALLEIAARLTMGERPGSAARYPQFRTLHASQD